MTGAASAGSRAGEAGDGLMTGRGTQRCARWVHHNLAGFSSRSIVRYPGGPVPPLAPEVA